MKKAFLALLLAVVLGGWSAPAQADTSFTFMVNGGSRGWGPPGPPPSRSYWRHHHYRYEPVYYAPPVYMPPPRPVVYQTTVVQPVVRTIPASVLADQASPTYTDSRGRLCREYQSVGYVGGARSPVYGTACLQPDGAWRVMD